jgi:hypothetical protein
MPNRINEVAYDQRIVLFLNEIETLCRKYDLSIAHEDNQGAFIIQRYKHSNISWLKSAIRDARNDDE